MGVIFKSKLPAPKRAPVAFLLENDEETTEEQDLFEDEEVEMNHAPVPKRKLEPKGDQRPPAPETKEVVRLSFSIDQLLHRRLKVQSVMQGKPLSCLPNSRDTIHNSSQHKSLTQTRKHPAPLSLPPLTLIHSLPPSSSTAHYARHGQSGCGQHRPDKQSETADE